MLTAGVLIEQDGASDATSLQKARASGTDHTLLNNTCRHGLDSWLMADLHA